MNKQNTNTLDIQCGDATVVHNGQHWVLPGGGIVRNKTTAMMFARRMKRLMGGAKK